MPQQHPALQRMVLSGALVLGALPGAALAEHPQDSFWGELAYFYPTIDSTARLDLTATAARAR